MFPKNSGGEAEEATAWSALWGPTCDGLDLVVPKCRLPQLHDGDWLTFDNMGAYTLAAGCEFNGFPRPQVNYFVRAKDVEMLSVMIDPRSEGSSGVDSVASSDAEW